MNKRINCKTCKKFNGCRKLCDKAASYVAKDEVKQREVTIGIPVLKESVQFCIGEPVSFTKREHEIVTLIQIHGFSRKETAKYLRISMDSVRNHISRIRKKMPT